MAVAVTERVARSIAKVGEFASALRGSPAMVIARAKLATYGAVFVTVCICLGVEVWMARPQGTKRATCAVVHAVRAIPEGMPLDLADVHIAFLTKPEGRRCEEVYLTEAELDSARWRVLRAIDRGRPLHFTDVERRTKLSLPRGRRGFIIHVDRTHPIREGDFVDVLGKAPDEPRVLASAVRVLEVFADNSAAPQELALSVALSQREVRDVEKAGRQGKLSIALVHPEDVDAVQLEAQQVAAASMDRISRMRPKSRKRVDIWHEN